MLIGIRPLNEAFDSLPANPISGVTLIEGIQMTCVAMTSRGTRCTRKRKVGKYCNIHLGEAEHVLAPKAAPPSSKDTNRTITQLLELSVAELVKTANEEELIIISTLTRILRK